MTTMHFCSQLHHPNNENNKLMKKTLYAIITSLCVISCHELTTYENAFANCQPCHVESIHVSVGKVFIDSEEEEIKCDAIDKSVEAEFFSISVMTYDSLVDYTAEELGFCGAVYAENLTSVGTHCKESIPEVEQHFNDWVKEKHKLKPLTRTICYSFTYRLEGVTGLTITANQPFNGAEAGTDISNRFVIRLFSPDHIFNFGNYLCTELNGSSITIAEWLNLKPLASPGMAICLTEEAQEAAADITFTITMSLTDGKVLLATTPMVDIIE